MSPEIRSGAEASAPRFATSNSRSAAASGFTCSNSCRSAASTSADSPDSTCGVTTTSRALTTKPASRSHPRTSRSLEVGAGLTPSSAWISTDEALALAKEKTSSAPGAAWANFLKPSAPSAAKPSKATTTSGPNALTASNESGSIRTVQPFCSSAAARPASAASSATLRRRPARRVTSVLKSPTVGPGFISSPSRPSPRQRAPCGIAGSAPTSPGCAGGSGRRTARGG